MMLKPSSSHWMRWSYLALIPILAAFMFACNAPKQNESPATEAPEVPEVATKGDAVTATDQPEAISSSSAGAVPFALIEVKPGFNGGDVNEFSNWVKQQLKYPEQALKDKAQGRVTLQFTIGTDGVLRDAKVVRGVREDLDAEALRVVSASPKWEPGRQDGKPVPVTFVFPVVYRL